MPSIFGFPTAEEIQQQRFQQAVQLYSQADPGVAPGVLAGQGVGRAVGGLLGIPDVQVERAKRLQAVQQEVGEAGLAPGDDGYLEEVQRRLKARGLFQEAGMVAQQGQEWTKRILQNQKLQADIAKSQQDIAESKAEMEFRNLPGIDGMLARITGQKGTPAELDSAYALAAEAIRQQGIPEDKVSEKQLRTAGRAIFAQIKAGQRTTRQTDVAGGSVSVTSPELAQSVAQGVVAGIFPGLQGKAPTVQAQSGMPVRPIPSFRPAPQGQPIEGLTDGGQTQPARRGPVGVPGSGRGIPESLNDAAQLSKGGKVTILFGPRAEGELPGTTEAVQIQVQKESVPALKKVQTGLNQLNKVIEDQGPAFYSRINQIIKAAQNAGAGDIGGLGIGAALRALGSIPTEELQDPQTAALLGRLRAIRTNLILEEKDNRGLGVLSGPDERILNALVPNPFAREFRTAGYGNYLRRVADYNGQLLSSAKNGADMGRIGITLDAPHRLAVLGEALNNNPQVSELERNIQQAWRTDAENPAHTKRLSELAARTLSEITGIQNVTPNQAAMAMSIGRFAATGNMSQQGASFIERQFGPGGPMNRDAEVKQALDIGRRIIDRVKEFSGF